MARIGLFDVHWHEWRYRRRRRVQPQYQQPQLRRPSGEGRTYLAGQSCHRRRYSGPWTRNGSQGDVVVSDATPGAFRVIRSRTVVLPNTNIDTDQIIPARFLTTTTRESL